MYAVRVGPFRKGRVRVEIGSLSAEMEAGQVGMSRHDVLEVGELR